MKVKKFRPINTKIHYSRVFDYEGIAERKVRANLSEFHDASIFLFKQILHPDDIRWRLARKYAELKNEFHFQPINLENAMRASYSSTRQGANKAYGASITGIIHIRQLTRALRNIELGHEFVDKKKVISTQLPRYKLTFERTRSIQGKLDYRGVSGCPEALWQLQLFDRNKYVGRIGFNFHTEGKKNIVTIANVQGASGQKFGQEEFRRIMGTNFGEYLITQLQETLGPEFEYRGAIQNTTNQAQYRMSFRKAKPSKIKVYSNEIRTMVEDRRKPVKE